MHPSCFYCGVEPCPDHRDYNGKLELSLKEILLLLKVLYVQRDEGGVADKADCISLINKLEKEYYDS